ncbi:MAG: 6-phosphogluconate dehydrogenase [Rhizobium sp.]|nr:MAG: 6-phosphogluconate dehydrogenase [Rhizobium sp.]
MTAQPDRDMIKVSLLGLGSMGQAAAKLLVAHAPLTVWNRTGSKSEALRRKGVDVASSADAAVRASPITIVSLLDNAAVRAVLSTCGASLAGRIVINLTNGIPAEARHIAELVTDQGGAYLHGAVMATPPMLGSSGAMILFSGSEQAYSSASKVLAALGNCAFLGTDPGQAPTLELGLLSIMYGLYGGFFHAAATLEAEGKPFDDLFRLAGPWIAGLAAALPRLGDQITRRAYDEGTSSSLRMQMVGMDHYMKWSEAQGIRGSLMQPMRDLMTARTEAGYGSHGIASIYELIRPRR